MTTFEDVASLRGLRKSLHGEGLDRVHQGCELECLEAKVTPGIQLTSETSWFGEFL
jgi:hypothetical protein